MADEVPVPLPIAAPVRVVPVQGLGHDMTLGLPIEQDCTVVAEGPGLFQDPPRRVPCEQATRQRVATQRPLDGPIRDDERDRLGQHALDDGAGERIAATGDQDHVDAGLERRQHRGDIVVGHPAAAVEQRAVDVDGDETNVDTGHVA